MPPLDGAGVVRGLAPGTAVARGLDALEEGGWSFVGLMLAWVLFSRIDVYLIKIVGLGLGVEFVVP